MKSAPIILVVGDKTGISRSVRRLGFRPIVVGKSKDALPKLRESSASLAVIDLPEGPAEPKVLRDMTKGGVPILILADPGTSFQRVDHERGRIKVLTRPVRLADLSAAVHDLLQEAESSASDQGAGATAEFSEQYLTEYAPLFAYSAKLRALEGIIKQVASTTATALIRGESGVGKEVVARAIHFASPRHVHPLVKVNCAALPLELLETELFGHERGAFTGAYRRKLGKFEFANKGTLFLDEIGELPPPLQAKLLHVLQDQEFSRLGGREAIRVDTRIIASTNRNLEAAIQNGQFREDLYYRLNVVEIHVPPLREQKEAIPALAAYFLEKWDRQYGKQVTLPSETLALFMEYPWPGNIRELENMIRRLVVLDNARQINEELAARSRAPHSGGATPPGGGTESAPAPDPDISLGLREIARRAAGEAERRALKEVIEQVHWNRAEAARILKVSYKTLLQKLTEAGLAPKQKKSSS